MSNVCATFFFGSSLPALAVRFWTRQPGQALADVPSHCALVQTNLWGESVVSEFVWDGFRSRRVATADLEVGGPVCLLPVAPPDAAGLQRAVKECAGERYSWDMVAASALNRLTPRGWSVDYKGVREYDCSAALAAWLRAGGMPLDGLPDDPSPNDLWRMMTRRSDGTP